MRLDLGADFSNRLLWPEDSQPDLVIELLGLFENVSVVCNEGVAIYLGVQHDQDIIDLVLRIRSASEQDRLDNGKHLVGAREERPDTDTVHSLSSPLRTTPSGLGRGNVGDVESDHPVILPDLQLFQVRVRLSFPDAVCIDNVAGRPDATAEQWLFLLFLVQHFVGSPPRARMIAAATEQKKTPGTVADLGRSL